MGRLILCVIPFHTFWPFCCNHPSSSCNHGTELRNALSEGFLIVRRGSLSELVDNNRRAIVDNPTQKLGS